MSKKLAYVTRVITRVLMIFVISICLSLRLKAEQQVVKIGIIFPLTGPMGSFGDEMAKALPLIETRVNLTQSKYKFKFVLEDGMFGQSTAAITAAKKLVSTDGVRFLVVGSSGELLQIAPFAERKGVVCVGGFASHPDIKNAGDFIFRTYVDAGRGVELVAKDITDKGLTRIAIISEESAFTLAVEKELKMYLGSRVVAPETLSLGESDFSPIVARSRSKNPDAYYLNIATPKNFVAVFQKLRANGINVPFYTYYVPSLKEVQDSLGNNLTGTIYLDFPETESSKDFTSFQSEYEKQHGEVKALFNFKTNYNAIKVLTDSIEQVGSDPIKVRDYLYKYDRDSAAGRLRFDKNGEPVDLNLVLKKY